MPTSFASVQRQQQVRACLRHCIFFPPDAFGAVLPEAQAASAGHVTRTIVKAASKPVIIAAALKRKVNRMEVRRYQMPIQLELTCTFFA